jgi:competence protein ComEA
LERRGLPEGLAAFQARRGKVILKSTGAAVKSSLNLQSINARSLCRLALAFLSAAWLIAAIVPWAPVSARQDAGPSATTGQSSAHSEFPPGTGRDAVLRLCVRCHSPNIILASGRDRTGWENTITKMVGLGATGSDEDFTDIADYLTANFPPSQVRKIFVNMATAKQFAATLEISDADAQAIVDYRDKQKGFKSIDDLKKVPNIDTAKVDAKKDRLVF